MRLEADPEAAEWLAARPVVQWDRGNRTKSMLKHQVTTEEVESLLGNPFLFAGRIVEPRHLAMRKKERLLYAQNIGN